MHEEYALRDKEESKNVENVSSSQTKEVESVGDKRKSRFAQFVETIDKEPSKTDLDLYLEESIITTWDDEKMGKFDILSWWKANFGKYPILAKVARDVLGIPASTVASESAFSTGGRVIHCYRSRMTTDTVEALICTQDWIKAEQGVTQVETSKDDVLDVAKIVDDDDSEIAETFVKAPLGDIMEVNDSDDGI